MNDPRTLDGGPARLARCIVQEELAPESIANMSAGQVLMAVVTALMASPVLEWACERLARMAGDPEEAAPSEA